MNKKSLVFGAILFWLLIGPAFCAQTLEDRLSREIKNMKGIKMIQISFSLDGKTIVGAKADVRIEKGYKINDLEKNAIIDFIIYSTNKLTSENIKLNVTDEPLIAFQSPGIPYNSLSIEEDLAKSITATPGIEEAYVNLVGSKKNFLGEFDVMSKAAVLVKFKKNYEYTDKEIFAIVDFLCKSVQDLSMDNILIVDYEGNTIFEIVR